MSENYILDSSIWIDINRGDKKILGTVTPIINKDKVVLVDLIIAEVLRGALSVKDYLKLEEYFSDFPVVYSSWLDVAKLAFNVSRRGFNPPLADVYIANCAINYKLCLISRDRHFISIARTKNFNLRLI